MQSQPSKNVGSRSNYPMPVPPLPSIDSILGELQTQLARLDGICHDVEDISNHLSGVESGAMASSPDKEPSDSRIDRLCEVVSQFTKYNDQLEYCHQRIRRAITG